jgi:hypothetical protein
MSGRIWALILLSLVVGLGHGHAVAAGSADGERQSYVFHEITDSAFEVVATMDRPDDHAYSGCDRTRHDPIGADCTVDALGVAAALTVDRIKPDESWSFVPPRLASGTFRPELRPPISCS